MAFEGLSERLENSFKKLRAKGKLTESDVKEAMREVRLALLEADVNYKVSKEFTSKVTERAIGADVMESLTPGQMVIKIVNEELTELMGGNESRLAIANHPPTIVMMCGLQGSGKTTHSAKLALKLKKEGHRPRRRPSPLRTSPRHCRRCLSARARCSAWSRPSWLWKGQRICMNSGANVWHKRWLRRAAGC